MSGDRHRRIFAFEANFSGDLRCSLWSSSAIQATSTATCPGPWRNLT